MGEIAFGIIFARESATPGTYTAIAKVSDVVPPSKTREVKDATHHGSTGGYREYIGGLKDGGEATVELHFEPGGTGYSNLETDMETAAPHNYQITIPGASTAPECTFAGLVTEMSPATPFGDVMKATVKIKVTGEPVWAA